MFTWICNKVHIWNNTYVLIILWSVGEVHVFDNNIIINHNVITIIKIYHKANVESRMSFLIIILNLIKETSKLDEDNNLNL